MQVIRLLKHLNCIIILVYIIILTEQESLHTIRLNSKSNPSNKKGFFKVCGWGGGVSTVEFTNKLFKLKPVYTDLSCRFAECFSYDCTKKKVV